MFRQKANGSGEWMPGEGEQRDAPRLESRHADLHVSAHRQRERERRALLECLVRIRFSACIHEDGRHLVEMRAERLEDVLRCLRAPDNVRPESLAFQRAHALARQLLGLLVAQRPQACIQGRWRQAEHRGERVRGAGPDHVALAKHLELVVGEADVPAHQRHGLRAQRRHELRKSDAEDLAPRDRVEAREQVVLRRDLAPGDVQHLAAKVIALYHGGQRDGGIFPPQRLEGLVTIPDLRHNRTGATNHAQEHRDLLVSRPIHVAGPADRPRAPKAAHELLRFALRAVIR